MTLGLKESLLVLLALGVLNGYDTAEFGMDDASQRLRTAPLKNVGNGVIDGSGSEPIFNYDNTGYGSGERDVKRVSVSTVAIFTLAMAGATGLGAIPFFFLELDSQWSGICNGMAAGVMLAASFDLIQEGRDHGSGSWVIIGLLAGGMFIWLCKKVNSSFMTSFWLCKLFLGESLVC